MRTDIYLPFAEAQLLASIAPWIIDLYPFTKTDVNLLFLEVDQRHLVTVTSSVQKILGEKAIVSSEISIQEELEDLMFLSDQMIMIFTAVIVLLALGLLARSTATEIGEHRRELSVFKAMGWTQPQIINQLSLETAIFYGVGGLLGLLLTWLGIAFT